MFLVVNCLSLIDLYWLRLVSKRFCFLANNYKSFKKYLSLTNAIYQTEIWNHILYENLCWLFYDIRKRLGVGDMAPLSYVRYEIFSMFDYLTLYNVFNHFASSTRICDINGISFDCSRVYFTKDEFVAQWTFFPQIRYSGDFTFFNLSQMLLGDGVFSFFLFSFFLSFYLCEIQSRKNGCIFFKPCNNSFQGFAIFIKMMRLYLNPVSELYRNLFKFVTTDFADSTYRFY